MKTINVILFYGGPQATKPREELLEWFQSNEMMAELGVKIVAKKVSDWPPNSGNAVHNRVEEAIDWADLAVTMFTPDERSDYGAPNVLEEFGRWISKRGGYSMATIRQEGMAIHSNADGLIYIGYNYDVLNECKVKLLRFFKEQIPFLQKEPLPSNEHSSLIGEVTKDFVGRAFAFEAIDNFLEKNRKGYLSVIGDPGMGKTTILAKYVQNSNCPAYFNERLVGNNTAPNFIQSICSQLMSRFSLPYKLSARADDNGKLLLQLLYEIEPQLSRSQPLVIVVDALDEVNLDAHPAGANILFLPERLPNHIYFILAHRRLENLSLRLRVPHDELNLLDYGAENQRDIQTYIRQEIRKEYSNHLRQKIYQSNLTLEKFIQGLAKMSQGNFMYCYQFLKTLNKQSTSNNLGLEKLKHNLSGYYLDHWKHMRGNCSDEKWFRYKLPILAALTLANEPITIESIQQNSKIRERARIRKVLKEWQQFLRTANREIEGSIKQCYTLYHRSFHEFISGLEEVADKRGDLGVTRNYSAVHLDH